MPPTAAAKHKTRHWSTEQYNIFRKDIGASREAKNKNKQRKGVRGGGGSRAPNMSVQSIAAAASSEKKQPCLLPVRRKKQQQLQQLQQLQLLIKYYNHTTVPTLRAFFLPDKNIFRMHFADSILETIDLSRAPLCVRTRARTQKLIRSF